MQVFVQIAIGYLFLSSICLADDVEKGPIGAANTLLRKTKRTSAESRGGQGGAGVLPRRQPQAGAQRRVGTRENYGREVVPDKGQRTVPRAARAEVPRIANRGAKRDDRQQETNAAHEVRQQLIGYRPQCSADVDSRCPHVQRENNFQILFCLQRQPQVVSKDCHQVLWQFKWNLTQDERLDRTIDQWCHPEIANVSCGGLQHGKGELLACLLSHRRDIKSPQCQNILQRIQMLVFSDFRLIRGFVADCKHDIEKFKCAKVESVAVSTLGQSDTPPRSQGLTIACLEDHIDDLTDKCQKQLSDKEEQAADDVSLDRALAQACQQELDKFCHDVSAGEGFLYDCLFHHKFDKAVSKECKKQIRRRQKIEGRDYKADYSFTKACKNDIQEHDCSDIDIKYGFGRMAKILLCLDEAEIDGPKLSKDCQSKVMDAKEQIMGDYELSHGLVDQCHIDVNRLCKHEADSEEEGAVIDCLMGKVTDEEESDQGQQQPATGRISPGCAEELQKLIQRADPGSDYHIDHALERACRPFIDSDCKPDSGEGDAAVLSCLMEKVDSKRMGPICSKHLIHLQYFIARDFKLDHQLFKTCKDDAFRVCKATFGPDGEQTLGEGNLPNLPHQMVLACLYRAEAADDDNDIDEGDHKVSHSCHTEVLRVLRERAVSIRLNPALHEACLTDLGTFCPPSGDDDSQEFKCLQRHYEDVSSECKGSLKEWTAAEAEDIRINRPLVRACQRVIEKYCKDVANAAEGALIQCLVEHKNDADFPHSCSEEIESFQKISMKDKIFDFKLRKACRDDGKRLCPGVKTRQEVLTCFKRVVMTPQREQVSQACLTELKSAFREQGENIELDASLNNACKSDARQLCNGVTAGDAKVVECLRQHDAKRQVSPECHTALQEREKLEVEMPEVDYKLMTVCKLSISSFCKNMKPTDVLYCLEQNKLSMGGDVGCQRVVTERQIESGRNINLDPRLLAACQMDIPKFCRDKRPENSEVIPCLKKSLDKRISLTDGCKEAVKLKEKESLVDVRLDAQFYDACKGEKVLQECLKIPPGSGAVDCLRKFFGERKSASSAKHIQSPDCIIEVGRMMYEGVADVHNDPLLFTNCALDLQRYCGDVPFGAGKKITCLLEVYATNKPHKLSKECSLQVSLRVDMWDSAVKVAPPDSFPELVSLVMESESRGTFLTTGTLLIIALVVLGCFFGRKCRRRRRRGKTL